MEIRDLYNSKRELVGKSLARGKRIPLGSYILVVHACIFNSRGQMLIQRRQVKKRGWPNMWDLSCGGSAVSGEDSQEAIHRELLEELGIKMSFKGKHPATTIWFKNGFDDIYLVKRDLNIKSLKLQEEEVAEVRWASKARILMMMEQGTFIPYKKAFIDFIFSLNKLEGPYGR